MAAHLFQLLIAAQLPLVTLFLATADWARPARSGIGGVSNFGRATLSSLRQGFGCRASWSSSRWSASSRSVQCEPLGDLFRQGIKSFR